MDLALRSPRHAPGLAFGSFLNVVAARVPLRHPDRHEPRSRCMSCSHELARPRQHPARSPMLLLRGRCRYCQRRDPAGATRPSRLATALLVAACGLAFGAHGGGGRRGRFFVVLARHVSAIDIEHRIVPNRIVLPAAADRPGRRRRSCTRAPSGRSPPSARPASCSWPRSRTRRAWAWATSSSRCCSARCSAGS